MSSVTITNCMDCAYSRVLNDYDPDDWFCDDDKKVICAKNGRGITYACRPHHLRDECEVPKWCPLSTSKNTTEDTKNH